MGRLEGANVLVTGGTGFIGTHLIQRLVAEGWQIRATFHKQEPFLEHDAVQYLRADLTRLDACRDGGSRVEQHPVGVFPARVPEILLFRGVRCASE